jgi:hypothetical protein
MDRRRFLQLLGLSAAAAAIAPALVLDPERALWIPGAKTYFFGGRLGGGKGYNQFLTPDWITKEALRLLEKDLALSKLISRTYDDQFYGVQVGKNVSCVKPIRFADALLLMPVSTPNLDPGTFRLYGEPSS